MIWISSGCSGDICWNPTWKLYKYVAYFTLHFNIWAQPHMKTVMHENGMTAFSQWYALRTSFLLSTKIPNKLFLFSSHLALFIFITETLPKSSIRNSNEISFLFSIYLQHQTPCFPLCVWVSAFLSEIVKIECFFFFLPTERVNSSVYIPQHFSCMSKITFC